MVYKKYRGGEYMFEIVGKLRCPVCREPVRMDEKVFLDIANSVIHQECYYKSPKHQYPLKDKGSFKRMILKYPFFY
jgi:hypothetical protein